jgi:epoxyqueuosine reductase QueG
MSTTRLSYPSWLISWMQNHGVPLWGAANLREFKTPADDDGLGFSIAISFALPMSPEIMASIQKGPNRAYADEYARVNERINDVSAALSEVLNSRGIGSQALAASERTDKVRIMGDFPHKTAATRAGIGWIGRHCQLITRPYGPWVRLGTIFMNMEIPCGPPVQRSFCGTCRRCVEACPAGALHGEAWHPGIDRQRILDVQACDAWKKKHYMQFHNGHNCGICAAVCPYGIRNAECGNFYAQTGTTKHETLYLLKC